jgi:uncharacterized phiE125 gp8 family phage protein
VEIRVTTAPVTEPVELDDVKAHLRITADNEDSLLTDLITSARQEAEKITGRSLAPQTITLTLDSPPLDKLTLPRPPAVSVTSVSKRAEGGSFTAISSSLYSLVPGTNVVEFPSVVTWGVPAPAFAATQVVYEAGYEADDCPQDIKLAIMQMVAHWHANRGISVTGTIVADVPMTARSLLEGWREMRL